MPIRLAARAVILQDNRLLLVNAFPGDTSDLWCVPGGGVDLGQSLPDTLRREVHEECGLTIDVESPCLVNEFHNPDNAFHQVEVFFRCNIITGTLCDTWLDPEAIVTRRRFVTRTEMAGLRFKPDSLPDVAFGTGGEISYDPLEQLVK